MSEHLLTVVEAAEVLKVKKNTVYDMVKRGDLKGSKLGKQIRIRQEDLNDYIQFGSQKNGHPDKTETVIRKDIPAGGQSRATGNVGVSERQKKDTEMIICGQDMVLDMLADRLSRHPRGCAAFRSYKGSYNALYAMYQGAVDVATAHLWHGASDSYNLPYISSMLPGTDVVVVHILRRKQGFYVRKGNPKNILTFQDLKRQDVAIVNREPGSGSRVLMDEKLRCHKIRPSEVRGYSHIVNSHLEAAVAVAGGDADVALGTEKHSFQVQDIDFIFQQEESYDMVIRKEDFHKEPYQVLLEILRSEEYQKEVKALGGYDITDMGKIIYFDE